MKKIVSILLICTLIIMMIPETAVAQEKEQYYSDEQMEMIVQKYESIEDMFRTLFCNDSHIGYWGLINNTKENKVLTWALDMSSMLIGEYPEKEDYARMLSNLIMMQSGQLAEQIENQSRFDDLKDAGDYAWDLVEIAAAFVGGSGILETISTAIDTGVDGVGDVFIKNNDLLKYYEMTLHDYSQTNSFLRAVAQYAENEELRNVAASLIDANGTLVRKRLDYLAEAGENIFEYEAKFFIKNMSMELLKEADLYATDETVKWFVDEGITLKNSLLSALDSGKAVFKTIILLGDIGFGTSDIYNRYQEMKVLADISHSLVKANKNVFVPYTTNERKIEAIQEKCNYYKALLVTHARGEYLMYQMLMNDGGMLSDIQAIKDYFKNPEDTTDDWYEAQVKVLTKYCDLVDNMFVVDETQPSDSESNVLQEEEQEITAEWKEAYINYVNECGTEYDYWGYPIEIYKLININNDNIPELYINFGGTATGDVLCTYSGGKVVEQPMWNYGLSYIEGQNLFRDSGGHMDVYYDKIYSIQNDHIVLLYEGNYGASDNSQVQYDSNGNPIYDYYWNGIQVSSEAEYRNLLNEIYHSQQESTPFDNAEYNSEAGRYTGNGLCNYEEIIEAINTY